MKAVFALVFLAAGITASILPDLATESRATREARLITDTIISAIEDISQDIRDAGLDPLRIERKEFSYELPVPVIFNAAASLVEVRSTGLSDIIINQMTFTIVNPLLYRVRFNIELPHVHLSTRQANGDVTLFGQTLRVESDGSLDIRRLRVAGEIDVRLGIVSGISVSSIKVELSLGSVNTNIRLAIQGRNYSEQINKLISSTIPDTLNEFSAEINELIEILLYDIISDML